MLGTDKGGAAALPCVRRRLVLVEQRRLGCDTGRRESQRPLVSLERESSSDAAQEGLLCFPRVPVLRCNQDTPFPLPRERRAALFGGAAGTPACMDRIAAACSRGAYGGGMLLLPAINLEVRYGCRAPAGCILALCFLFWPAYFCCLIVN